MTVHHAAPLPVHLARDADPAGGARMALGTVDLVEPPGEAVAAWFRAGVRHVTLPFTVNLVDLDPATLAGLLLVREATSRGISVDWRLTLPGDGADWRVYSHLHPPADLRTAAPGEGPEHLAEWRRTFYIDKCTYRHGPGFVQVRDRRTGKLNLLTIDDPAYLAVLDAIRDGAPMGAVDLDIARDFASEGLVTKIADTLVWLPYRLRRWPLPSMIV